MKKTAYGLFVNSAAVAFGVLMVLAPVAATAAERGHASARGGGEGSLGRGGAVGHFSGGGGHTTIAGERGRFTGSERIVAGSGIGVRSNMSVPLGGGFGGRYYRGAYFGIGTAPYAYGYYPGYAVAAAPPPCTRPLYDAYGNAIEDPACYSGEQPYMQEYGAVPQEQYPAQRQPYPAQQQQQYPTQQQQYPAQQQQQYPTAQPYPAPQQQQYSAPQQAYPAQPQYAPAQPQQYYSQPQQYGR